MKHFSKAIRFSVVFLFSLTAFTLQVPSSSTSNVGQFIPRTPPGPNSFIGYYACSSTMPCPEGVVDYGMNKATAYSYHAVTFDSWANFTKLAIGTSSIGCIGPQLQCMTIQQNLVDYNAFEQGVGGSSSGEYWAQDVPFVAQKGTTFTINQLDNIWNFSAYPSSMGGTIYPNLLGNCGYGGLPTYYYCLGTLVMTTTLPFEILMTTTTGVLSSGPHAGSTYIEFGIWVYHSGKLVGGSFFDQVAFSAAAPNKPYFFVSGATRNPYGIYNDAETVLCGPGGGSTVRLTALSASFTEAYMASGSATLKRITHAWSAGTDTAETISNVKLSSTVKGIGTLAAGADNNKQLW
ncbi:MAG: thermopsin family protease [Candidatus Bathyarchaeia archaeon]